MHCCYRSCAPHLLFLSIWTMDEAANSRIPGDEYEILRGMITRVSLREPGPRVDSIYLFMKSYLCVSNENGDTPGQFITLLDSLKELMPTQDYLALLDRRSKEEASHQHTPSQVIPPGPKVPTYPGAPQKPSITPQIPIKYPPSLSVPMAQVPTHVAFPSQHRFVPAVPTRNSQPPLILHHNRWRI